METIQCSAPRCPRPSARADKWCSLTGFGIDGVAHPKCVKRLYKLRARAAPLDTPRGRHTPPLVPCSSPLCPAPLKGYRKPGAGPKRPVRRTIEGRTYCLTCFLRVCRRLKAGLDPNAPDDDDDTGPEPTEAEIEALFAPLNLAHANLLLAALILPPPSLDELDGAEWSWALIGAFERRDLVMIYQGFEMWGEVR